MKGFFFVIILTVLPRFQSAQLEGTSIGEIIVLGYVFAEIALKSIWRSNNNYTIKRVTFISILVLVYLLLISLISASNGASLIIIAALLARLAVFFYVLNDVQNIRFSQLPTLKRYLACFSVGGLVVMILNLLTGTKTGAYGLGFYSVTAANLSGYLANATLACYVLVKIMQSLYTDKLKLSFNLADNLVIASIAFISILTLSRTAIISCGLSLMCILPSMLKEIPNLISKAFYTLLTNKIFLALPVAIIFLVTISMGSPMVIKFVDILEKVLYRFGNLDFNLADLNSFAEGIASTGRIANKVPEINRLIADFNVLEFFIGRGLGYSLSWSKSADFGGMDSQIYAIFVDTGLVGLLTITIVAASMILGVLAEFTRLGIKNKNIHLLYISAIFNFGFLFTNEYIYLLPSYAMAGFLFGLILWMKNELSCFKSCKTIS